jgi:hypothetical protein
MTFDIEHRADETTAHRAQRLHEFAVNHLNLDTDAVLFTAKGNGAVQGQIEPDGDAL